MEPRFSCELEIRDGMQVLHLRMFEGPLRASLRARLAFPNGVYRLTDGAHFVGKKGGGFFELNVRKMR